MLIDTIRIETHKETTSLLAQVHYKGKHKTIYITLPIEFEDFLIAEATPFFTSFFLGCMRKREKLSINASLDEKLASNIHQIKNLVYGWDIGYKPISVSYKNTTKTHTKSRQRAMFFSGGVDSWYSYLQNQSSAFEKPVSHWIVVHGFDIDINNNQLFDRVYSEIQAVAKKENITCIPVKTNVREILDQLLAWDYSHGSAMAGVAQAMSANLGSVLFSGGTETKAVRPYGIHPELDPLWSTTDLDVIHIGLQARRIDKVVNWIANSTNALESLRVCWKNPHNDYNCGQCEKCFRTMLALKAAGVYNQANTFPKEIDLSKLSKLVLEPNQIRYFQESLDILKKKNTDQELIQSLESLITNNLNKNIYSKLTRSLRKKISEIDQLFFNGSIFKALSHNGIL